MMNLQIVLDNENLHSFTLHLQCSEEVAISFRVIALCHEFIVDQSSFLTDRSYDGNGVTSELQHSQFHSHTEPTLGCLLPQIACRFIDEDDLIECLLLHVVHQLLNVIHLNSFEVIVLSLRSPIFIVRLIVTNSIAMIVPLQSLIPE